MKERMTIMLRMMSIGDKLDSCPISKRATSGDNKDKIKF